MAGHVSSAGGGHRPGRPEYHSAHYHNVDDDEIFFSDDENDNNDQDCVKEAPNERTVNSVKPKMIAAGAEDSSDEDDGMAADYYSAENHYDLIKDDPSVATLGYKTKDPIGVCKYILLKKRCPYGKHCQFRHITEEEVDHYEREEAIVELMESDPIPLKKTLLLRVTAVESPLSFYGILLRGTKPFDCNELLETPLEKVCIRSPAMAQLDKLSREMSKAYKNHRENLNSYYAYGELVAFKEDEYFLRGRILASFSEEDYFDVQCLDTGTVYKVHRKHMFKLLKEFALYPAFAFHCCIANVVPISDRWSKDAISDFYDQTFNKNFIAIVSNIDVYGKLEMDLYTYKQGVRFIISEYMIDAKYAKRLPGLPLSSTNEEHPALASSGQEDGVREEQDLIGEVGEEKEDEDEKEDDTYSIGINFAKSNGDEDEVYISEDEAEGEIYLSEAEDEVYISPDEELYLSEDDK